MTQAVVRHLHNSAQQKEAHATGLQPLKPSVSGIIMARLLPCACMRWPWPRPRFKRFSLPFTCLSDNQLDWTVLQMLNLCDTTEQPASSNNQCSHLITVPMGLPKNPDASEAQLWNARLSGLFSSANSDIRVTQTLAWVGSPKTALVAYVNHLT